MGFVLRKLKHKKIWRRIFRERLTEPVHLNLVSLFVYALGSYRAKAEYDLIVRQQNAYSLFKAADYAESLGIRRVSILEFGVAAGAGLLNLAAIARRVGKETGIQFSIYGFDTGTGMPPPQDYRDHPDMYQQGEFGMDVDVLRKALPSNVKLVLGDIAQTVGQFVDQLSSDEPIGFVSVDVDYYSSTANALQVLAGSPEKYLPITVMYFDDIGEEPHNSACGELLAIEEFNVSHTLRKIEQYKFLANSRVFTRANWIRHIYFLHVLDHPHRCTRSRESSPKVWHENPYLDR